MVQEKQKNKGALSVNLREIIEFLKENGETC